MYSYILDSDSLVIILLDVYKDYADSLQILIDKLC